MFKTIKSRVIFVIVFCVICIAITTGAIIYKNIEIDETEGAKKEEARLQEDTVKGVNLKGTYNQNDLSISEKRATKEKIEIIPRGKGLYNIKGKYENPLKMYCKAWSVEIECENIWREVVKFAKDSKIVC